MNPLISQFKKYGQLSVEIESELNTKINYSIKQKGDFFLKQGQIISSLGVMENGLVRAYFIDNKGVEINSWFGFENMIIASVMPLSFSQKSREFIQFLEPSAIYTISNYDLNTLYTKYPEMNTIGRKLAEDYCKILEERIISLQTESAEQRYKSLINNQPEAVQRISLGHIASYLGITQETLSRIRRKVHF